MNKKTLIIVGGLLMAAGTGFAQKAKVREATKAYYAAYEEIIKQNGLSGGDPKALNGNSVTDPLNTAKAAIDEACNNPETSVKADTWVTKGLIYTELSRIPNNISNQYYMEALKAFEKALSINPKVGKSEGVEDALSNIAIYSFNGGIAQSNESKYDGMVASMTNVKNALTFNNNEFLKPNTGKDTLLADAEYYIAFGNYSKKDFPATIAAMESAMKNPINKSKVDAYRVLAFAYGETKDFNKQIATIEAAKKMFPTNKDVDVDELNFYISQDRQAELVSKFETAVQKDPNNSMYLNNLGVLYRNMGMEKNGKFPEDADSWHDKALVQIKKAIELDPKNAILKYNLSTVYILQADKLGNQMNSLGTSKVDNQKYDVLSAKRKLVITDAITQLEAAEALMEPKFNSKSISTEEKGYLMETVQTLKLLYGKVNNSAKMKEYKQKLEDYESKM